VVHIEGADGPRSRRTRPVQHHRLGELGVVGVAAATANAIYHATGRRLRSFRSPSTSSGDRVAFARRTPPGQLLGRARVTCRDSRLKM
jgi:hypothetical protein